MRKRLKQASPLLTKDNKLKKSYKTLEEAAQAKTDFVMKVALKDVDWSQLDRTKK
jgi:BioD-like phosphotransacetylase family protein